MKNVDLQKLIYINTLIAHRRTGNPLAFAAKLNLSRSALFEYLDYLRHELMLEIKYNNYAQTYYYSGDKDFCALMGGECCQNCQKFADQTQMTS